MHAENKNLLNMSLNLKVLSAGALFFIGGHLVDAQAKKKDSLETREIEGVVFLGVTKKKSSEVVGNAVQLGSKDLNSTAIISVDQAMQGKTPGVVVNTASGTPGSQQSIMIRGVGSINASISPLYVIDGVPMVNGDIGLSGNSSSLSALASINNGDIETLTVLKDAAATALYGARGSNGVVVITTKSGRRGKTKFSLNTALGFQNEAYMKMKFLNGQQKYDLLRQGLVNENKITATQADALITNNNLGGAASWIAEGRPSTNWVESLRNKNASLYNVDLSASGGDERGTFYASMAYNRTEPTIVTRNPFERVTGLLKVTRKFSDKLNFEGSASGSWISQSAILEAGAYFGNPYLARILLTPWASPFSPDGSPNIDTFLDYTNLHNIHYRTANDINRNTSVRAIVNSKVDYKILKNLTYTTKVNLDYISAGAKVYNNRYHGDGANVRGRASQVTRNNYTWVVQNSLDYKFKFGDHSFTALALYEYQSNQAYTLEASGESIPTDGLSELSVVSSKKLVGSELTNWKNLSYLGMLSYNYAGRLVVDGSIRREASSRFAPGQRFGTFWSVGGAYNLHKDIAPNFFNELRLRASYGVTGNSGVALNSYQSLLGYDADYSGDGAAYPKGLPNQGLTWEKNKTLDFGLSFAFLDRRISGSVAYYNKNTYDLLLNVPTSRTTGFSSIAFNAGAITNKGIEALLSVDVLKTDNFTWNLSANIATVKNTVDKLALSSDGKPILPLSNSYKTVELGKSYGFWFMPTWAGVNPDTGAPEWYLNGVSGERTSKYNDAKRVEQGVAIPKYTGGLSTHIKYKNVFLDASVYFAGGHKVYDQYAQYYLRTNNFVTQAYNGSQELLTAWQQKGDITNVPKMNYRGNDFFHNTSSRHLYDGTFARLKDVTLGYSLPSEYLKDLGIDGLTFTIKGTNLFTWVKDKKLLLDPETSNGTAAQMGFTTLFAPPVKSVIFGVNFKF